MKPIIRLFLFTFLFSTIVFSQEQLLRFPAINNDGSVIAFSFQGDIWTVASSGGKASRLTIHEAYESNPVFSPDGSHIAFSGNRFGNNDIFSIPVEGGNVKRLTYHSAPDNISSWSQKNNILFSSNREFNQIERPSEVFQISPDGGTETRILNAVGFDPVISPSGRFILFVRGDINPVFRETYRGPSNRDIYIYDTKNDSYIKLVSFATNDILPKWSGNNTIYFLSANSGRYNLYKLNIDETGKAVNPPTQLTYEEEHPIRHFDISGDGLKIVYEQNKNLFLFDTNNGNISKINIKIAADERLDADEIKSFTSNASEVSVSPNGKLLAFVIRGDLFVKEVDKDKNRTVNLSDHPYRDYNYTWLSDSTIVFVSDRNDNNFDLYLVRSSDKTQSNIFKSLKHEVTRLTETKVDESSPVVSNNGKQIVYVRGTDVKEFVVADISADGNLSNEKILLSGWNMPSNVTWSPDNKWLAYSLEDLYFNEEVFIQPSDDSKKPVNVSMHPRYDGEPFWSVDGSKLGFISSRNNLSNDVWFVWLKKSDWEKTSQDWDEKEPASETSAERKDDKSKESKKTETKVKPIEIDFENIHERVVQVTNFPGNESNITISKDGETFFYTATSSSAKGRDLYSIKWNGKDLKEITKGGFNPGNVFIDRDGKYLYYTKSGGTISRQDVKADKSESLPYNAKMKIDYIYERDQIFEEAWRSIRDGFYDPQFHGKDWNQLKKKYKDLCLIASTSNDLRDMFNYMLGELNASHMGFTPQDRIETQKNATGLLGAELIPQKDGMKILRVIPNSPADKISSKLSIDDLIISVDGISYDDETNFYTLLNSKVDEKVLLEVKDKSGNIREVVIRPSANIRQLLYEEWVADRKKLVEKYSNGKLGYIHIQGMSMPSFEVFERELTVAGYRKEGLVVDVRYNGGGSTTDYLMAVLNYKQHAYTIPRGAVANLEKEKLKFREFYPLGERLVFSAWTKPSIALCNEGSYSNAEIFSHAYKTLGIGKLVGYPTNGSVISTGGRELIDGSFIRMPSRAWFTKATNQNQELGPAIPDIIVENGVDWIYQGEDAQLKKAVEELLNQIGK